MSTYEKQKQDLVKSFLLVGADHNMQELPYNRRWWMRKEIYLSDICLVVHISPGIIRDEEIEQAKEALYAYLRRIGQTMLDHNLIRPIACVISAEKELKLSKKLLNSIRNWGSDQEWHRGGFTLYVELPHLVEEIYEIPWGLWDRVADLLDPKFEALTLLPEKRGDILTELDKLLQAKPPEDSQTRQLTYDLAEHIKGIIENSLSVMGKNLLENWEKMIKNKADRISTGEL